MIADQLKDRKPGDKPRFFLHDEMKAWLKENMVVTLSSQAMRSSDFALTQKLNLFEQLTTGHHVDLEISIAGETLTRMTTAINMSSYEKAFQTLTHVVETCMIQISNLREENNQLRKRIELIETPLPL